MSYRRLSLKEFESIAFVFDLLVLNVTILKASN